MSRFPRRSILRGLAAMPLAGASAAAKATIQPDPIFAAIEKHRAANEAFAAACARTGPSVPGCEPDGLGEAREQAHAAESEARFAMHRCVPQTVAGLAAYVAYWADYTSTDEWLEEEGWEAIPTIAEAMAALFPAGGKDTAG